MLKRKRNHYNVKLLRGYGVSISLKNNKLILKNGIDVLSGKPDVEEWFVTKLPYEKIVVSGRGYISTEAIKVLNDNNKNVILTNTYGKPISFINGAMESLTGTRNRIAQYDAFRDSSICEKLTRMIVSEKLKSQIRFLELTGNDSVIEGKQKLEKLFNQVESNPQRVETLAAKIYFAEFAKLIPAKYEFESRNQSSLRITKRRASDVINGLLNYGYTVLAGEISKFVCGFGLDPYYGFYHKQHTGFQPLVYDLIEPFRWLVEYSVWILANSESKHKIRLKDYTFTKNGAIILDENLIKRFLERLVRTFQMEREYKFKHGRKMKNGMSMCQEITIVKIYIENILNM